MPPDASKKCERALCENRVSASQRFCSKRCSTITLVGYRRKELKRRAVAFLGGRCQTCGYDRCLGALVFRHTDPTAKEFGLSSGGVTRSWVKVQAELEKCLLLCHNCHAEVHEALDKEAAARRES